MGTYRKRHLTPWRTGWRYMRRVPVKYAAVVGATAWTKYLGNVSEAAAVSEAHKLDVVHDALIARLKSMSSTEHDAIIAHGGIARFQSETMELEKEALFNQSISVAFSENAVDLDHHDALEQIKSIRASKARSEALRGKVETRKALTAKTSEARQKSNLAALIPLWERIAVPKRAKSVSKKHLYLSRFVKVAGNLAPNEVKRSHVIAFRDSLEKAGQSKTNVKHMLEELHRLFAVALSENMIDVNPFTGVKVSKIAGAKFSDDDGRKPFTGDQIKAILDTADALEGDEGADRRWIIRLLAYHGARSGEICQLRPSDVTTISGVPVLRITDEVGSLKNRFSKRDVPIHPSCWGIVDYAKARAGKAWLFNDHTAAKDRAALFQSWAPKFLAKITSDDQTMHSLRHSWRTIARELNMPEAVSRAIMGHSQGKDDHAAYGAGPSLAKRAEWIACVDPLKA